MCTVSMRISVWNICGLNMDGRTILVRDRFLKTNSNMIGLVETKLLAVKGSTLDKWLSKDSNMNWIEVPASESKSGGLLLAWDNRYFSKTTSSTDERWILVEGRLLQENIDVSFLLVYAPNKPPGCSSLYKQFKELQISHPLMVFGDFNEVRKLEEKKNTRLTAPTLGMIQFETWIKDMKLSQIPLSLRNFTWYSLSNKQDYAIDSVFVQEGWTEHFKVIKSWGLETSRSDHSYIFIGCNSDDWVPENLDRFTNLEFKKSMIKKGKPLEKLKVHEKLRKLKTHICTWNWYILDNIKTLMDRRDKEVEENLIDEFTNLSIANKLDIECSNSTCVEVESMESIERILEELKVELGELYVQREEGSKLLNVIKIVELGIKLEELVIELKKKPAQCEGKDSTLVLEHAERILHYVDKLDIYGEDSDVTDAEVVQNINNKINYLTCRIEDIDIRFENTAFTFDDKEVRRHLKRPLTQWLISKELDWFDY